MILLINSSIAHQLNNYVTQRPTCLEPIAILSRVMPGTLPIVVIKKIFCSDFQKMNILNC